MSQVRAVFEFSKQGIIVADTGIVSNLYVLYFPFTAFQPNQEDEQMQRPEVREEDLTEAKNKLGAAGPPKSKTMEVMEECGKDTHAAKWFDSKPADESERNSILLSVFG